MDERILRPIGGICEELRCYLGGYNATIKKNDFIKTIHSIGGNNYKLPHMGKDKWVRQHGCRLPLRIRCTAMIEEQGNHANEANIEEQGNRAEASGVGSPTAVVEQLFESPDEPQEQEVDPSVSLTARFEGIILEDIAETDIDWEDPANDLDWDDNEDHDGDVAMM